LTRKTKSNKSILSSKSGELRNPPSTNIVDNMDMGLTSESTDKYAYKQESQEHCNNFSVYIKARPNNPNLLVLMFQKYS
jgi:hypothetical protein